MKLSAANREAVRNFLIGEHGRALLDHLESKTPRVNWDDKCSIEKYAIVSAESRGWFMYQEALLKTIAVTEEKNN